MKNTNMERMVAPEHPLTGDRYPLDEYNAVGKRVRRKDGREKATGYAIYTSDVQVPGMLWLRILACPYPHARIKTMETSKAERVPGVRAVLRYDDPELPAKADTSGHFGKAGQAHEPVLDRVGYWQGMPMGVAVAADNEDIANRALSLVEIEWEERPFNLDPEKALEPGAPLSNPESYPHGNAVTPFVLAPVVSHGNLDEGFKEADGIIEFRMRRDQETWVGPERPCGVFRWNADYPEVWVKHQRPHLSKRQLAEFFEVPVSQVTVHCLYQGASFGGWSQMALAMQPNYIAGILSKRTGRPVKWQFSRREDFAGAGIDNARYTAKVGFKNDGTITAVTGTSWFSKDGNSHANHFIENTKVRNVGQECNGAVCNILHGHALRCEQNPYAFFFTAVMGHVAEALEMDPIELALKNDGSDGLAMTDFGAEKIACGFSDRDSLKECLDAGKKAAEWDNKWHAPGAR